MKPYLDTETLKFMLYEVSGLRKVLEQPRFEDHDEASVALLLNAVLEAEDHGGPHPRNQPQRHLWGFRPRPI